ncbi:MAG: BCSC C-terminal domain-containing protein [Acidobacteriia bacterium]|nr:BCSC C-terminal domain-containing protein [Methyloceanibacter sp.]MCL6490411.1 BCSC C-terminal domain-containing protein [Terriglobia bacterium]
MSLSRHISRAALVASTAIVFAMHSPAQAQKPDPAAATAGLNPPPSPQNAIAVLLKQAKLWRATGQLQAAVEALHRALRLDPGNPDVLASLVEIESERGQRASAQEALARLRQVAPQDPRIATLALLVQAGPVDKDALAEARRLASEGRTAAAIAAYRRAFHDFVPQNDLAVEYYETLAGTETGWDEARQGLSRVIRDNPQDLRAQLAYAQILTYREPTRVEGIRRLLALSDQPPIADAVRKALRQALSWLPQTSSSVPLYEAYLQRFPGDTAISNLLNLARNPELAAKSGDPGRARMAGFEALRRGRLDEAARLFQAALDRDAQDSDALGGLGLVRLRQGRIDEGRSLLQRAIAAKPAEKAKWQAALEGTRGGIRWAEVKSLAAQGRTAEAEALLRRLMGAKPNAGALLLLADLQQRQGKLQAAEASYRQALAIEPKSGPALIGLAGVLAREGRAREAEALYAEAETVSSGAAARRARAQLLREQAQQADPSAQVGLYRAALASDPNNPWIRLDLARVLEKQGRKAEAQALWTEALNAPQPSTETIEAATYFAMETNDLPKAAALIGRLPPGMRTPDMNALVARVAFEDDVRRIVASNTREIARARLLALAAQSDPEGFRGAEVIRALARLGDQVGAREAANTALAATPQPTAAQRIAYAGALLEAGQAAEVPALLRGLDGAALTPDQARAVAQLRTGAAVRMSDTLSQEGHLADAYDQLAPALARNPTDPDLNMALARLYLAQRQPRKALAIDEALLQRDPQNLSVRQAAVDAAIAAGELGRARRWADEGTKLFPTDPRAFMIVAGVARAEGNDGAALRALRTARNLRLQQLAPDRRTAGASLGPGGMSRNTPDPPSSPTVPMETAPPQRLALATNGAYLTDASPPVAENPFRRNAAYAPLPLNPDFNAMAGSIGNDPILSEIDQQIVQLEQEVAPKAQTGFGVYQRSGTPGLDQLVELMTPVEATFSPGGVGHLKLTVTPTYLDAGTISSNNLDRFGTLALFAGSPATPNPGLVQASGIGAGIRYDWRWLEADVGATPVGFRIVNPIGGIELSPLLTDTLRLRVTAEDRPVTDSVLSYAGLRDPRTGAVWGGVTRARGHIQLEYTPGLANFYVGGGYDMLTGQNVERNTEWEFNAGASYAVYRGATDELRVGLDLFGFGYDKNLYFFTLGGGGYFSPQSYYGGLIPVTYRQKLDNLTWSIGGSIGYQTFTEDSNAFFPLDPVLQAELVNIHSLNPAILAFVPGQTVTGVIGGVHGSGEYQISTGLAIGGSLSFQRTANWNEASALVYARVIFNGNQ